MKKLKKILYINSFDNTEKIKWINISIYLKYSNKCCLYVITSSDTNLEDNNYLLLFIKIIKINITNKNIKNFIYSREKLLYFLF